MNIGIIGAGKVGGALGKAWAQRGHRVLFGVRDPQKDSVLALLAEAGPNASAGGVPEAIAFGEIVVLAVRWDVAEDILLSATGWEGKVLVDVINRFTDAPRSVAEDIAALAPGACVVKAFNTIGAEHLAAPQFGPVPPSMLICGDDEAALAAVAGLAAELGFDPQDCGPLANAALLEAVARLWFYLGNNKTGRDIAFALLRRGDSAP